MRNLGKELVIPILCYWRVNVIRTVDCPGSLTPANSGIPGESGVLASPCPTPNKSLTGVRPKQIMIFGFPQTQGF